MKTKTYTFTEIEILALREAMIEFKHSIKNNKPISPIFIEMKKAVTGLAEQFKDDYRNI